MLGAQQDTGQARNLVSHLEGVRECRRSVAGDFIINNSDLDQIYLKLWHPFRVPTPINELSGGLRYAPTTGYSLAALRAASGEFNIWIVQLRLG